MLAVNTTHFLDAFESCRLWTISNFSIPHPSVAAAFDKDGGAA
jgi:hypothetical protein